MFKKLLGPALLLALGNAEAGASLTAQETRWLAASEPVLMYARQLALPIDVIVQPQARATDVPFAMGYDGKRCKLVLSMRGGGDADAALGDSAAAIRPILMEAAAAHEFAHCWRAARGAWHSLPAGFVDSGDEEGAPELLRAAREQREQRREEAYADLAALAWTAHAHPESYASVHAWLTDLRAVQPAPRSAHDTRPWLPLAVSLQTFKGAAPFSEVEPIWRKGLLLRD